MTASHRNFLTDDNGVAAAWTELAASPAFGRDYMTVALEQGGRVVKAWDAGTDLDQWAASALAEARDPLVTVYWTDSIDGQSRHVTARESEVAYWYNQHGHEGLTVAYPPDPLRAWLEQREHAEVEHLRLAAEQEYTDSQRLDELATADDYNRFEEAQIALDNEQCDFDPELPYDYLGGEWD